MPLDLFGFFRRIGGVTSPPSRENDEDVDEDVDVDEDESEEIIDEEPDSTESSESIEETSTTSIDEIEETNNAISEGEMIPVVPDPKWLEDNGWEYVGFRVPRAGEIFITKNLELSVAKSDESIDEIWDERRWIIRPKKAAKIVTPMNSQSSSVPQDIPPEPSVPDVQL